MDDKFYVRSIVRDDGVKFEFDATEIYLSTDNTLLVRPDIDSSEVQYTDIDGGEMIHQRLQVAPQVFNGVIMPRTTDYWTLYFGLSSFFKINHTYRIIYKTRAGLLFAQRGAWLAQNLQVSPNAREDRSDFSVGFKLQSSSLYEYAEDNEGNEIYANIVTLPLITANTGGEVWDSDGEVWDSDGEVWEAGSGGIQSVSVDSATNIYPVWTVVGLAVNPSIQNNFTDTTVAYSGTVGAGQTLIVDFQTGIATLDGAIVSRNVDGQIVLAPGMNSVGFNVESGTTTSSTISWNNTIG